MMTAIPTDEQGTPMGLVHVETTLTNLISRRSVTVRALVDTGCFMMAITANVAHELEFDLEEMRTREATLADGSRVRRPVVPLQVGWQDRTCTVDALVMGDECLMGAYPLEGMGLIVDPVQQRIIPNPEYPDGPVWFGGLSGIIEMLASARK